MPLAEAGAVIVAAGQSVRMGGGPKKQYRLLGGLPVVSRTLGVFEALEAIKEIVLVVPPGDEAFCYQQLIVPYGYRKIKAVVPGGKHRQDSVWVGLRSFTKPPEIVLVHDAVRPLIEPEQIEAAIRAAAIWGAAVVAVPAKDTVKLTNDAGFVMQTLPREQVYLAQTPQAFRFDLLVEAHKQAQADGYYATDDTALVERLGFPVKVVAGAYKNLKLTTPEDFTVAAALLGEKISFRVGFGYDAHRFAPGRPLILGGVEIPWGMGLEGHSDADVLCHAVMDALLGGAGAKDIGHYFPPTDERYRGISSLTLLAQVRQITASHGFQVANVDGVIVAEKPRLAPFIPAMVENIARVLEITPFSVNIKATTTEGLGFTGREEGIAAYAVTLLQKL